MVYFSLSAVADWAMINNHSGLWHGLRAGIDCVMIACVIFFVIRQPVLPDYWEAYFFLGIFSLTIRDITRTIVLGIGTTSWIDRHIKGWWRFYIHCLGMFLSICYFIWFFTNQGYIEKFL